MIKITIENSGAVLECAYGENLYAILSSHGLIDAPCGGRGVCGKCAVDVDGKNVLSCEYRARADISVRLPENGAVSEIASSGFAKAFVRDEHEPGTFGIAIDIGTTTVAASLYDMHSGAELLSRTCLNSQKSCGQDVISRINCCIENEDGLRTLQELILGDLRGLISELSNDIGIDKAAVKSVTVAGNTTMIHLLGGIDPRSISAAPYRPAFEGPLELTAGELKFPLPPNCPVWCVPAVSSFVGGDITAGVLACGTDEADGRVLFIDIGTNGEMVLSDGEKLFACSCAAGPALEGMNISCGMRAAEGAIEDVSIGDDGSISFGTIGGTAPRGICGSGLLSLISELRRHGVINSAGRFTKHPLVTANADGAKSVLLDKESGVSLTQGDVRHVQLAKGAVLSGVLAMLGAAGLRVEDIDRVIVAGQFGAHLKPESITGSGLLPKQWTDIIEYAGNTSISGAAICLMSAAERARCADIVRRINYIELSTLDGFDKLFVDCLKF